MTKWVVFSEPFAEIPERTINQEVHILADDVIAFQMNRFEYKNAEDALEDFCIVHWAVIVEKEDK